MFEEMELSVPINESFFERREEIMRKWAEEEHAWHADRFYRARRARKEDDRG